MGRKRGYRIKKRTGIEGLLFLVIFISIILAGLIVSLRKAITRVLFLFSGLTPIEWGYIILFCAFLYFLYHLSKVREQQELEREKVHSEKMKELNRKKQIEKIKAQTQLNEIKNMDPFEFEKLIKEVYELMGYKATLTPKTGDGGKDIILKKNPTRYLLNVSDTIQKK